MHASCVVHLVGHAECKLGTDQQNEWTDTSGTLFLCSKSFSATVQKSQLFSVHLSYFALDPRHW